MNNNRYHDPQKPNQCPKCDANVVVLTDGECLDCTDSVVTPTMSLMETDWSPEKYPEEAGR